MMLSYFIQGFRILPGLAMMDLFKKQLGLQASYVQVLTSFISLPWSFKIVYGLISDNIRLCGYRRKSYIILFAMVSWMTWIFLSFGIIRDEIIITVLLCIVSVGNAFTDVVVDALMVI